MKHIFRVITCDIGYRMKFSPRKSTKINN